MSKPSNSKPPNTGQEHNPAGKVMNEAIKQSEAFLVGYSRDLEDKLDAALKEKEELTEKLKKRNAYHNNSIDAYKKLNKTWINRLETEKTKFSKIEKDLNNRNKEAVANLERQLKSQQEESRRKEQELENGNVKTVEKYEAQLKLQQEEADRMIQTLKDQYNEDIKKMKDQLELQQQHTDNSSNELARKLQDQLNTQKEETERGFQEYKELRDQDVKKLEGRLEEAEKRVKSLGNSLDQNSKNFEAALRNQMIVPQNLIKSLEAEKKEINKQLEEEKNAKSLFEEELKKAENLVNQKKEELDKLEKENHDLRDKQVNLLAHQIREFNKDSQKSEGNLKRKLEGSGHRMKYYEKKRDSSPREFSSERGMKSISPSSTTTDEGYEEFTGHNRGRFERDRGGKRDRRSSPYSSRPKSITWDDAVAEARRMKTDNFSYQTMKNLRVEDSFFNINQRSRYLPQLALELPASQSDFYDIVLKFNQDLSWNASAQIYKTLNDEQQRQVRMGMIEIKKNNRR